MIRQLAQALGVFAAALAALASIDAMYRDERVVSDRTVDSHIKKIRRKISAVLPDREIVHSVYGLGYKYEP